MNNDLMIKKIATRGVFRTERIVEAFKKIDRAKFVKPEFVSKAYDDAPLPIHAGQTISQPTTVAFMLELLQPQPGERIMDVGAGSGWTTALLAELVGPKGYVYGVELMPDLIEFGRQNLNKFQIRNASIVPAKKKLGIPEEAPFDRILVSAYSRDIPTDLIEQLVMNGRMVIPINHSVVKIDRMSETEIEEDSYPGFVFVPLIKQKEGDESGIEIEDESE